MADVAGRDMKQDRPMVKDEEPNAGTISGSSHHPRPKAERAIRYARNASTALAVISIVSGAGLGAWLHSGLGYEPFLALLSAWLPLGMGLPMLSVAVASDMLLLPMLRGSIRGKRMLVTAVASVVTCALVSAMGISASLPAIEDTLTGETTVMTVSDGGKSIRLLDDPAGYDMLKTQEGQTLIVPASLLDGVPVGADGSDVPPTIAIKVYRHTLTPISVSAVD